MHDSITRFVSRAAKTTVATSVCVAMLLADGQPARAAATVTQVGNTLNIAGTGADDTIWIVGVDGLAGIVTVNVDDLPMVAHHGVNHIQVDLFGGHNTLIMVQVHLEGNVTITAGNGENDIVLGHHKGYMPNLIWGHVSVVAGHGVNTLLLEESWIVGNASLGVGDGGNYILLGHADSPSDLGAVILGDLSVAAGAGDDRVEIVKSWLDGQTDIDSGAGDDEVILGTHYPTGSEIAGNVFAGDLSVTTGDGADGVGLTDNEVQGDTTITLGKDGDTLLLGAGAAFPPNTFHGKFTAHGNKGLDTLEDDPANFYAVAPVFVGFELP
jgi:hypothetical protein